MRTLKFFLIALCVLALASAITGIESVHSDAAGAVVTRHSGLGRVYALAMGAVCALAWAGVHRRLPIVWKLGWVVLAASLIDFLFSALSFALTLPSTQRLVLSAGVVLGACAVAAYWGIWWHRQRGYFTPEGMDSDWVFDLTPLRWFGIGMFALGLIFILAALAASAFHR
jgi:hypothetical protein